MPKSLEINCSQRFTCSKKNVHNHIEEYTYVYEFCAADLNRDARMTALKYAHNQFKSELVVKVDHEYLRRVWS